MIYLDIIEIKSGQDFGTVESVDEDVVTISKETWAPGLWCGCEGREFYSVYKHNESFSTKVKCIFIDLEKRQITFDDGSEIYRGDILRLA